MHFELLTEDQSGGITVEIVLRKLLGENGSAHSWRLHSYKGVGRIPKRLQSAPDPARRLLLNHLPRLLRGYGQSLLPELACVVVVVDLDNADCTVLKQNLLDVLNECDPRPTTLFRIAIEEGESWLLGDRPAVNAAYPRANAAVLDRYAPDSICGTWEMLADAVHPGGSAALRRAGYPSAGRAKCDWARRIAPHMDVDRNRSKSFQVFRDGIRRLAGR